MKFKVQWTATSKLYFLGFLFRVLLLFLGVYLDANGKDPNSTFSFSFNRSYNQNKDLEITERMPIFDEKQVQLQYTDVDYHVITDGARYMSIGQSPYQRATFRYSPLLAFLMLGNIYFHPLTGKLLFILSDILVGKGIEIILQHIMILKTDHHTKKKTTAMEKKKKIMIQSWWMNFYICIWLFNPIVINISTRGSADSLVCGMIILTCIGLYKSYYFSAGVMHGLAVHFKIYPIIYSLAYLGFIYVKSDSDQENDNDKEHKKTIFPSFRNWKSVFSFILGSAISFLVLCLGSYYLYQDTYLYEGFLYHLIRVDNRHNYSMYFYPIYLYLDEHIKNPFFLSTLSILSFLPQVLLIISTSWAFRRYLPFSIFYLTWMFVTFNKVCTGQYFIWYISLLPIASPYLNFGLNDFLERNKEFCQFFMYRSNQGKIVDPLYIKEKDSLIHCSKGKKKNNSVKREKEQNNSEFLKNEKAGENQIQRTQQQQPKQPLTPTSVDLHENIRSKTKSKRERKTTISYREEEERTRIKNISTRADSSKSKIRIEGKVKNILFLLCLWLIAIINWLYNAYLLEFCGVNTFLRVWVASSFFFIVNIIILMSLLHAFEEPR